MSNISENVLPRTNGLTIGTCDNKFSDPRTAAPTIPCVWLEKFSRSPWLEFNVPSDGQASCVFELYNPTSKTAHVSISRLPKHGTLSLMEENGDVAISQLKVDPQERKQMVARWVLEPETVFEDRNKMRDLLHLLLDKKFRLSVVLFAEQNQTDSSTSERLYKTSKSKNSTHTTKVRTARATSVLGDVTNHQGLNAKYNSQTNSSSSKVDHAQRASQQRAHRQAKWEADENTETDFAAQEKSEEEAVRRLQPTKMEEVVRSKGGVSVEVVFGSNEVSKQSTTRGRTSNCTQKQRSRSTSRGPPEAFLKRQAEFAKKKQQHVNEIAQKVSSEKLNSTQTSMAATKRRLSSTSNHTNTIRPPIPPTGTLNRTNRSVGTRGSKSFATSKSTCNGISRSNASAKFQQAKNSRERIIKGRLSRSKSNATSYQNKSKTFSNMNDWSDSLARSLTTWMNYVLEGNCSSDAAYLLSQSNKTNSKTKKRRSSGTKSADSNKHTNTKAIVSYFANGHARSNVLARDSNGAVLVALSGSDKWREHRAPAYTALFDLPLWQQIWNERTRQQSDSSILNEDTRSLTLGHSTGAPTPSQWVRPFHEEIDEHDGVRDALIAALLECQTRLRALRQDAFNICWGDPSQVSSCGTIMNSAEPLTGSENNEVTDSMHEFTMPISSVATIMSPVEAEVESGKLQIRPDCDAANDKTMRESIVALLLHYHPAWLRLGLETVVGDEISFPHVPHEDGGYPTLRRFILSRFLKDKDAVQVFQHTKKGRWDDRLRIAQNKYALQRIFMLVLFLDRAATQNLFRKHAFPLQNNIEHCLFVHESPIKSSRQVLRTLTRDFLAQEGDIEKHLSQLGYTVAYSQDCYNEYSLTVPLPEMAAKHFIESKRGTGAVVPGETIPTAKSLLAASLRDGIRLTRIIEHMCSAERLLLTRQFCRLPAETRTARLHNLRALFKLLTKPTQSSFIEELSHTKKLQLWEPLHLTSLTPEHIADAKEDQSIAFLWTLVTHFHLPTLIPIEKLSNEIKELSQYIQQHQIKPSMTFTQASSSTISMDTASISTTILLQWISAICSIKGISIDTWSTGFEDGKVICAVVQYYRPDLITMDFSPNTTENPTHNETMNRTGTIGSYWRLAARACAALGCSPSLLPRPDTMNKTSLTRSTSRVSNNKSHGAKSDEKSTMMFMAMLSVRLLQSTSQEVRSVLTIQRWYRKCIHRQQQRNVRRLRKLRRLYSCICIQRWFRTHNTAELRQFRLQKRCATVVQQFWRYHMFKRSLLRERIISTILGQCLKRRRKLVIQTRRANARDETAISLQSWMRMLRPYKQFTHLKRACITLQRKHRAIRGRKFRQTLYTKMNNDACRLQANLRCLVAMHQYQQARSAAVRIQSFWRCILALGAHTNELQNTAACIIQWAMQDWLDSIKQQRTENNAILLLQSCARMYLAKVQVTDMRAQKQDREEKLQKELEMKYAEDKRKQQLQKEEEERQKQLELQRKRRQEEKEEQARQKQLELQRKQQEEEKEEQERQRELELKQQQQEERQKQLELQRKQQQEEARQKQLELQRKQQQEEARQKQVEQQRKQQRQQQQEEEEKKLAKQKQMEYLTILAHQNKAAQTIQSIWRTISVQKKILQQMAKFRLMQISSTQACSHTDFSTIWRKLVALRRIQYAYRQAKERIQFLRIRKAVVHLQAAHRGYQVRRTIGIGKTHDRILQVARRVAHANMNAASGVQCSLAERCESALSIMQAQRQLASVCQAASSLAFCCSISHVCCQIAIERQAGKMLFALLRSCNRSAAHQRLAQACLDALWQLSHRSCSATHVYKCAESVDVLVDVIQMFRDIKALSGSAAQLLWRIVNESPIRQKAISKQTDLLRRLHTLQSILERKGRTVERTSLLSRFSSVVENVAGVVTHTSPTPEEKKQALILECGGVAPPETSPVAASAKLASILRACSNGRQPNHRKPN